jgi:hypothetical protein
MLWTHKVHVLHLYGICVKCVSVVFFKVKGEKCLEFNNLECFKHCMNLPSDTFVQLTMAGNVCQPSG